MIDCGPKVFKSNDYLCHLFVLGLHVATFVYSIFLYSHWAESILILHELLFSSRIFHDTRILHKAPNCTEEQEIKTNK